MANSVFFTEHPVVPVLLVVLVYCHGLVVQPVRLAFIARLQGLVAGPLLALLVVPLKTFIKKLIKPGIK